MSKITKYILFLLFGLGVLFTVLFFINQDGLLEAYMIYAYILFFIAIALALTLPIINMVGNPKSLKKSMIGILGVAVIVGFSYLIASGDPVPVNLAEEPSFFTLKATDAGIIMCYILLAVSFIVIIAGSIINMVRNR